MSAIVLCVTLNETKLFADTLERVETCGLAEHVHTAECYDADGVVVCGLEAHEHTDACYQARLQKDQPEQEVEEEPVADLPEPSGETVSDGAESTEPDPDALKLCPGKARLHTNTPSATGIRSTRRISSPFSPCRSTWTPNTRWDRSSTTRIPRACFALKRMKRESRSIRT